MVPSDTCPIYVSYIRCAKIALTKTKSTNIVSVTFASTKSEYSRVLFCKWLFWEENVKSLIFCNIFQGYDSYPIVSYMSENAILPEGIMNGSKCMSIEVSYLKMKFIDSMNCIAMALSLKFQRRSIFPSWLKDTSLISSTIAKICRPSFSVSLT